MNTQDRMRGTLFGLAVGDALGAAVEFKDRGTFAPVTCYRDGGPHRLAKGQWTDDTSMALALADSIGNMGWNLDDQMRRYLDWWQNGEYSVNGYCFDIGTTTRFALNEYINTMDADKSGDPDPASSGNGSIMRLAPVAIHYGDFYPDRIRELSAVAKDSSLVTHASSQCISACRYMAVVLSALIVGEDRETVLSADWPVLKELNDIEPLDPLVMNVAKGSFKNKHESQISSSGWVIATLEAALWAFHSANNFEEAVLNAVNLGDDSDSVGAVCGQFAGAYWGESGIPKSLLDGLDKKEMLEKAMKSLERKPK